MSVQSFQAFTAQISQDSTLRDELRSKAPGGMSIEQFVQEGAARGFAFDQADVTGTLSDADLDHVTGGTASGRSYTGGRFYLDIAQLGVGYLRQIDK